MSQVPTTSPPPPRRVVRVYSRLEIRGIERQLLKVLPRLESRGRYRTTLLLTRRGGELLPSFREAGLSVELVPLRGRLSPGTLLTLARRFRALRADIVQLLADMKPGFIRFPGGCIVEGKDLDNAYRWKHTVGDVAERRQNWNRWQDAVGTKAPHYYQTYGLGFFEYFQLCEDIGAEAIPILNCGMSCQYQDGELVPLAELDPWVQDAIDLVEFANGPADSGDSLTAPQ